MDVISIRTPSLGDATYVVVHGDHAVVVDPQRDIARFTEVLDDRGVTLTHVLETHIHNDYISGGKDLAASRGADLVLPAASGAGFFFVPAFHHEELEGGDGLVIRPIHTPGHTPDHVSYLLSVEGEEGAVFTGGSLLVGAAGRSDLLGDQYARQLARLQYRSLHRLGSLPDATGVFPTHGEGSFCSASGAGRTTSTVGQEKLENPVFRHDDAEAFADDQLGGLAPYPTYYAHMGPANKVNPTAATIAAPPELTVDEASNLIDAGAVVLDGRGRDAFASGHLPDSIGIELGDSFAPWAGWLIEYNAPIVMVLEADGDSTAAATELARIGFTQVRGVLRGVDGWAAEAGPLRSFEPASHEELSARLGEGDVQILDVRDPLEWKAGHLQGAIHGYVPDLKHGPPAGIDPDRPVWVVCRTGNRATMAAGLLERHGIEPVVVTRGGVPDLLVGADA